MEDPAFLEAGEGGGRVVMRGDDHAGGGVARPCVNSAFYDVRVLDLRAMLVYGRFADVEGSADGGFAGGANVGKVLGYVFRVRERRAIRLHDLQASPEERREHLKGVAAEIPHHVPLVDFDGGVVRQQLAIVLVFEPAAPLEP